MIPKKIHLTWKTKDLDSSKSEMIKRGYSEMKRLNPAWKITISDDNELDDYLHHMMPTWDYRWVADKHPVVKSDVWRLYKMYYEGGMYVDIDRLWNVSLDSIITDDINWVLPTCLDYDFSHDVMCSAPGNQTFATAIDMQSFRRKEGHRNVYYLGPQTYMHAITYELTGMCYNTNPGVDVFESIRETIAKMPFVLTYREFPPHDTIIFRNDELTDYVAMKKEMYKSFELKHWTGEW